MDRRVKAATQRRHEAVGQQFADKLRSRVTATPAKRPPARPKAPFRRTFDSAGEAADEFYAANIDFIRPLVERGEPREAVREWLRSNHGKTGRMRVKDASQTPWAKKMIAAPNPIRAALTNIFGHARNRRWDRVDWDSVRALGEAMVDAATETTGPQGWSWYPVATEDDDAKILDRLSVEGDADAYRRFAQSLSDKEVKRVADAYADEVKRLSKCMSAERRRRVLARIEEIRGWAKNGIPETVCGQQVYAGHTCDLEPIHTEMQRLRDACSGDAGYTRWLNEAVRRSPRSGSVAELEDGQDDMPGFVPVSAFESDPDAKQSAPEDACTPSNAAKVMGRLGAKKRRENAAKRKKVRETNAALRKAERERVSAERRAQRDSRRRSKAPRKGTSSSSKPKKTDGPSMLIGLRWRWKANPGAWLLLNAHGYQVASMSHSKRGGDWLAYYHPPGKDGVRVNIDDNATDDQAKAVVEVRVRNAQATAWWADLPKDGQPKKDSKGPLPLTHAERIAIGGSARDKALFRKHGKGRVGRLVVDYIDGSITAAENRELEALGLAKNDMLTDDGWVLYKSIKGEAKPKAKPKSKARQGSLVTPDQEGFALTHPKGTAAVHGKSAGTGGTQSTLPGVSRKVSTQKMVEMKARERKAARGSGGINTRSIDTMTEDDVSNAFYGKYDGFFSPLWLLNNILQKVPQDIADKGFEFRLGKHVDDASGQGAYAELYRNNKRLTHGRKSATLSVERRRAYYVVGLEGMPKAFATAIAKVASEVMNNPKLGMQDNGDMVWRHA